MFEDLINDKEPDKVSKKLIKDDSCPKCGSTNIVYVIGIFVSNNLYKQTMQCNDCGNRWYVVYNGTLSIVDND